MKSALLLLCVLGAALAQNGRQYTVNLTTVTACTPNCDFFNPLVWNPEGVPGINDNIDVELSGTYTIVISSNASIASITYGTQPTGSGSDALGFIIASGGSLLVTGQATFMRTSTVSVQTGASISVGNPCTVAGTFTCAGNCTYLMGLAVSTAIQQYVLKPIFATYVIANGLVTVYGANGLTVSNTANLQGTGSIVQVPANSGATINGNFFPGNPTTPSIGQLNLTGDLTFNGATVTFLIAGINSYSTFVMTGNMDATGLSTIICQPIGGYVPLQHTRFTVTNQTGYQNGFATIRGSGVVNGFLNNQWSLRADQSYLQVVYGASSTVTFSMAVIAACLMLSMSF